MPTGESISEVFVLKNPPTLVVRSVRRTIIIYIIELTPQS